VIALFQTAVGDVFLGARSVLLHASVRLLVAVLGTGTRKIDVQISTYLLFTEPSLYSVFREKLGSLVTNTYPR
jgi:hypothetical protein